MGWLQILEDSLCLLVLFLALLFDVFLGVLLSLLNELVCPLLGLFNLLVLNAHLLVDLVSDLRLLMALKFLLLGLKFGLSRGLFDMLFLLMNLVGLLLDFELSFGLFSLVACILIKDAGHILHLSSRSLCSQCYPLITSHFLDFCGSPSIPYNPAGLSPRFSLLPLDIVLQVAQLAHLVTNGVLSCLFCVFDDLLVILLSRRKQCVMVMVVHEQVAGQTIIPAATASC